MLMCHELWSMINSSLFNRWSYPSLSNIMNLENKRGDDSIQGKTREFYNWDSNGSV